jgi:predicted glycogen debranching enzyme
MEFGKGYWKTLEAGLEREWVITNGIGGYCGSSIINACARMHHAYLVASLHPPVERYAVLNKVDESIIIDGKEYSFATNARVGGWNDEGQKYLQRFIYDELPHFVYQAEGTFIEKTLSFEWEKNTIAIGYDIMNGPKEAVYEITPFFTYRNHSSRVEKSDLKFEMDFSSKKTLRLVPKKNKKLAIKLYSSNGKFVEKEDKYDYDMQLRTEINTGGEPINNSYTPYKIVVKLAPYEHKKVSVVCSIEDKFEKDAFKTIEDGVKRIKGVKEKAGYKDEFANALVQAADQFIVKRESTGNKTIMAGYPWFTDWGRDTMIALQGLTLSTKRFEDTREILKSFAIYVKKGLVPNMFPDGGMKPFYNTVDASLWYFYSVDKYLEYTGTEEDYEFIRKGIYEKLEEIIYFYSTKTDFSIYMEEDGLIHAGGGYDQVTWMDVRVGTWVVTPRHGKPVEINALWYNALKVMEKLSQRFGTVSKYGKPSEEYGRMAEKAKNSFNREFWNKKLKCLYDVVDGKICDDKIRPNQIYAVSLPYTMLDKEKEKLVVEKVISELYATYGLRTLDKDNTEYQPYYKGKLHDRDAAYHQGTAWAFPLGALVTAYIKVFGKTEETKAYARRLIEPLKDHLRDGCVGSIAEIFDGNEPNISRGTYAQAWSVGEILRAYTEDIL